MKSILLLLLLLYCQIGLGQNQKGIAFQAVARTSNGVIMPNKLIQIRISILKDTLSEEFLYQEIKSITTSPLGLFTILIGVAEPAKIVTIGSFENMMGDFGKGTKVNYGGVVYRGETGCGQQGIFVSPIQDDYRKFMNFLGG